MINKNAKALKDLYLFLHPYEDNDLIQYSDFKNIAYLKEYIAFFKNDNTPQAKEFITIAKKQIKLIGDLKMRFYEKDIVTVKNNNTEGKIGFTYKENGIRYYNVTTQSRAFIKCTAEDIELVERPATYDYIKKVDTINAYDKQMITKLYIAWELQPYSIISDEQIEMLYNIYSKSDYNGITPFIHDIQDYLLLNNCNDVQEYIDFIKD